MHTLLALPLFIQRTVLWQNGAQSASLLLSVCAQPYLRCSSAARSSVSTASSRGAKGRGGGGEGWEWDGVHLCWLLLLQHLELGHAAARPVPSGTPSVHTPMHTASPSSHRLLGCHHMQPVPGGREAAGFIRLGRTPDAALHPQHPTCLTV